MHPTKVSLCGLGRFGMKRLKALQAQTDRFEVCSVYDLEKQRYAGPLLKGVHGANNLDELLSDESEVLFVCTPNYHHFEIIKMAFKAKKHVFCEKPLCTSLTQLSQLHELANIKGLSLIQGSNLRFFPAMSFLAKCIKDEDLHIKNLDISIGHNGEMTKSGWHQNPHQSGGGTLIDNGIHALEFLDKSLTHLQLIDCSFTSDKKGIDTEAILLLSSNEAKNIRVISSWEKQDGYCQVHLLTKNGRTLEVSVEKDCIVTSSPQQQLNKVIKFYGTLPAIQLELIDFHEKYTSSPQGVTSPPRALELIFQCYKGNKYDSCF